jgi:hypothetical protein
MHTSTTTAAAKRMRPESMRLRGKPSLANRLAPASFLKPTSRDRLSSAPGPWLFCVFFGGRDAAGNDFCQSSSGGSVFGGVAAQFHHAGEFQAPLRSGLLGGHDLLEPLPYLALAVLHGGQDEPPGANTFKGGLP